MAVEYWNYWETAGTTSGTTNSDWYPCPTVSTNNTTNWIVYRVVRRYLVEIPESWNEKINAKFVVLLNDQTNTGFIVEMVVRGDIRITDQSIEVRTMEDFVPLLRQHAKKADWTKIQKFFKKYGEK